jgi:hypothetical protein
MPPNAPKSVTKTVFRSPGSTPLSTDFQISGRANRPRAGPDPSRASDPTDSHHWSPKRNSPPHLGTTYGRSLGVAELGRGAPILPLAFRGTTMELTEFQHRIEALRGGDPAVQLHGHAAETT